MKQHSKMDIFVIGFALFSMFFGAGNVIFPPYLGMGAGKDWILGFACYYLADIGLALIALFSMFKRGGADEILKPMGKLPSTIFMCAIVLCIGPMLALPRTAAMTFEMSVAPLTDSIGSIAFSVIFFSVAFLCSVRQNSVIDIVGKILTPLLLAGLLILIVKGTIDPLGPINTISHIESAAEEGIKAGYQTMDVLATVLFGALILNSAHSKGYTEVKEKRGIAVKSSIVAGVILLVVYCGLTYLGATVSTTNDLSVGRTSLMVSIVNSLLGRTGTIVFSLVVALACMTTAIGLVCSCSEYFCVLSKGKLKYKGLAFLMCAFSAFVSNFGLEQIVAISAPILELVYPPTLVLIAISFLPPMDYLVCKCATAGALVFSLLTVVSSVFHISMPFLSALPLASLGFGWIAPSVVFGLAGLAYTKLKGKAELKKAEE